jgi:hypothetical protein
VHELSGESASVSENAVKNWYLILAEILKRYAPRDIYNADESALYYNLLMDKTLAAKDEPCKGGKLGKECMTLTWMAVLRLSHSQFCYQTLCHQKLHKLPLMCFPKVN